MPPTGLEDSCLIRDGILNVYKPAGWTSHDIVAKLRKVLGLSKIGHAGTLDPAATGVLPILLGRGTRLSEFLLDWEKEYEAVLRLGQSTDTGDATGTILTQSATDGLTEQAIRSVVSQFQGNLQQVPPMFSAIKIGGQPLYKAARAGRQVERKSRPIQVHRIEVRAIQGNDVWLRITCSRGTYVRTLCADIGQQLGVGGHLYQLERTRVGPLTKEHALPLETVEEAWMPGRHSQAFLSLDEVLTDLPVVEVPPEVVPQVVNGTAVSQSLLGLPDQPDRPLGEAKVVRVKDSEGRLLGLGRLGKDERKPWATESVLAMKKVFVGPLG